MLQCVQSPGPSQPQDPFSDTRRAREVSGGKGGHPGPPYATAFVQRGGIVSNWAWGEWPLPAMKLWETTDWPLMTDVRKARTFHGLLLCTYFFLQQFFVCLYKTYNYINHKTGTVYCKNQRRPAIGSVNLYSINLQQKSSQDMKHKKTWYVQVFITFILQHFHIQYVRKWQLLKVI